jgi:4-amino-4-deoxy-L-arabinose transferase-like glycosyltransferase
MTLLKQSASLLRSLSPARFWNRGFILLAGIVLYATLAITSIHHMAAIFDEGAQFPAGYSYWVFGDFRMNPEHPPLVKLLASAPLLFMDVTVPGNDEAWRLGKQWDFGQQFLYSWNDGDRLLFVGRCAVVSLGCLLAATVFWWGARLWGLVGGAVALLLCALSPEILAHGRIVTFDVGIALFLFLTVLAFERLTERITWRRLLGAGLSLGAALATKESAVGLLPILAVLTAMVVLLPEPILLDLGTGIPRPLTTRRDRLVCLALVLLAMCVLAVVVIWAAYGFHSHLSSDPAYRGLDWKGVRPEQEAFAWAAAFVRRMRLLPEAYLYGFLEVFRHDTRGNVFLFGHIAREGFHSYYPMAFLIKTPLALLILLAASILLRKRWPLPLRTEGFLWLPVLVYFGLVLTRHVQNGHRHLLPIYPFLFVLAGRGAAWAASLPWRRPARLSVIALVTWYALATLHIHPHYFAYFNELVGGPENGYRYLVDSDLDWGQDLPALKTYLDANDIQKIKLSYFGSADPGFYGIDYELLPSYRIGNPRTWSVAPGDLVAVSATNLQGIYVGPEAQPLMERLRRMQPLAKIGYSIFVYRVDFALSRP